MVNMNGGKALMKALEKEGVKEVFGLPGGANLPMYDELYKSNIRHILVRHEQSAAHMADGFGRVSRKPGVCFATSGPGATNLLTGIATAQADSAPMVAVTGQVPVKMIGRDAFQESDIIGMSNPSVKYAFQPRTPEEIPEIVKKGFYIAETGSPGPVLLDIPKDVQQNEAEMIFPEEVRMPGYHPWTDVDIVNIERAISKSEANKNLNYNNLIYEGFGPEKIAIIIEALTDNKNRTASNIRTIFQKFGGNLGESGAVSHQFKQVGVIRIDKKKISDNNILELAINGGAEDCLSDGPYHEVITKKENFYKVKLEIEKKIQEFISSGIEWLPINKISLNKEKVKSVLDFLEKLEDDDDVQHVYANLELDDNLVGKKLTK